MSFLFADMTSENTLSIPSRNLIFIAQFIKYRHRQIQKQWAKCRKGNKNKLVNIWVLLMQIIHGEFDMRSIGTIDYSSMIGTKSSKCVKNVQSPQNV